MENHPIEGLMKSAMDSIQNMVDVNTIIGEPIETSNNMVIIPISKVCLKKFYRILTFKSLFWFCCRR